MNKMQEIRIEKITLNIGVGKNQDKLDKAIKLLNLITGETPIKTTTQKRIQSWGLRPGLPIGCKVTLRKAKAAEVLKKLIEAKDFVVKESSFDNKGNISFGLAEYIDIPGMKYNPEIGLLGLQISITLSKPGLRIKHRKIQKRKIGKNQQVTKEEAINYINTNYNTKQIEVEE